MKKPMHTAEFFQKICENLEEKGQIPEILDYALPNRRKVPITNSEFLLKENLDYGGSEGIYLDMEIEIFSEREKSRYPIGTFKTLQDDAEAMEIMGILLADFLVEAYAYVRKNSDDFSWEGYHVYAFDEDKKRQNWHYCCASPEQAQKRKEELLMEYPQVMMRENATRKEWTFYRDSDEEKNKLLLEYPKVMIRENATRKKRSFYRKVERENTK